MEEEIGRFVPQFSKGSSVAIDEVQSGRQRRNVHSENTRRPLLSIFAAVVKVGVTKFALTRNCGPDDESFARPLWAALTVKRARFSSCCNVGTSEPPDGKSDQSGSQRPMQDIRSPRPPGATASESVASRWQAHIVPGPQAFRPMTD